MKIVIVEDEKFTTDLIVRLIKQYNPEIQILKILSNVEESVSWLTKNNAAADLILMDVQLTDGDSFDIFEQVYIETPIIFITAFNEYAIQAFRVNSIDYLLKPLNFEGLEKAFDKYFNFKNNLAKAEPRLINNVFADGFKPFKSRFLIKVGEYYKVLKASEIAYFLFEDGTVVAQLFNGNQQIVDESLDELEGLLDPEKFYRLNRKNIASMDAIGSIKNYFNRRLSIRLLPKDKQEIISRERVSGFKIWMNF
jgi:DNA-binding LytR/AlgR family response regulator